MFYKPLSVREGRGRVWTGTYMQTFRKNYWPLVWDRQLPAHDEIRRNWKVESVQATGWFQPRDWDAPRQTAERPRECSVRVIHFATEVFSVRLNEEHTHKGWKEVSSLELQLQDGDDWLLHISFKLLQLFRSGVSITDYSLTQAKVCWNWCWFKTDSIFNIFFSSVSLVLFGRPIHNQIA